MGAADRFKKIAGPDALAVGPLALLRALRPLQWVKNGLVFLPFLFAVNVGWSLSDLDTVPELLSRLVLVFIAFCGLAGTVYLVNDLMDREKDRVHPVKRNRPIASGQVGVTTARATAVALGAGGLAIMFVLDWRLGVIGLSYVIINISYSLGVKNVVIADVLAVASGYVIRAAAGAVAIDVLPSPWLFTTTGAGALFIVLGRRYAEVRLAGDGAFDQRSVLQKYAGPFIGQLLTISATAAWLSYTLYTVEAENLPENNTMLFTLPLVTFGLFRYLWLLNNSTEAEAPEQLIIKDLPLVLSIVSWITVSALVLLLNN